MRVVAAFDHADMELVRQGEHRQRTQQRQGEEGIGIGRTPAAGFSG
jgi:hypothetical protein